MMLQPATTDFRERAVILSVAVGLALNLVMLTELLAIHARLNSDFMAFWSFPRFIAAGSRPTLIYNAATLTAFQRQLYPGFHSFYPFIYPPPALIAFSWLRLLPFGEAEIIWSLLGITALALGTKVMFPCSCRNTLAALLGSPAALLCLATGQTALFATALLLAGFACLPRRPVLAGFWFGLLTLKPQLGLLAAVFLLTSGAWVSIFAASLTALALASLSALIFPLQMWPLWVNAMLTYQHAYFQAKTLNLNTLITPSANAIALGLSETFAWRLQAVCGIAMIALTAWAARRAPYRLAVGITLIATLLAQPHAYAYDSLAAVAALALALEVRPGRLTLALGIATYLAPWLLLSPMHRLFFYAPMLAACLPALLALALRVQKSAVLGHEPVSVLPPAAT